MSSYKTKSDARRPCIFKAEYFGGVCQISPTYFVASLSSIIFFETCSTHNSQELNQNGF